MKRSITYTTLALIVTVALASHRSGAQTINSEYAIGLMPYQGYHGGDIDSINTYSGALSVKIPLMSYPQRGNHLKLDYAAQYNGKLFTLQAICHPGEGQLGPSCNYVMMTQLGPVPSGFNIVDTQHLFANPKTFYECPPGDGSVIDNTCVKQGIFYPLQVVSSDGATHYGATLPSGTTQETMDGTAILYNGGPTTSGTTVCPTFGGCPLVDSEGTTYLSTGTTLREDVDGNTILATGRSLSYQPSGTITDTMGRQIPAPPGTAGGSSTGCSGTLPITSVYTWTVPTSEGETATYKFCYVTVPVEFPTTGTCATAAPADDGPPYDSPADMTLLQSIVLPNTTSWTFAYEARATGDPTTINYGELTSITFPTGGSISYQYALMQLLPTNSLCSAYVTSRTVNANDGTGAHTWTYSYGNSVSSGIMTQVTDPELNVEQYIYGGGGYLCLM